nr:retrovirus-related Pol polyprotein from transposon TNT 1-94 [Tanacetum cinerariifolium]
MTFLFDFSRLTRNRTLVEAARTMLSAAKVPLFFWVEAIATACFTQNRSLVIPRHEKTPYHIINDRKPSVCYIVRDGENLDKIKEKDQISSDPAPKCQTMALNHYSLSPVIQRQENVTQAYRTVTTSNELDLLFSLMFYVRTHQCTAMSSAEAKYVALSASYAHVMWIRTQLHDYGFNYNKIPFYCDSQSAIAISCNPVQHSRTKHIHTRYNFIKKQVKNGIIELYFVRTEYQLADMFPKALPKDRFKYLVRRIGMRCLTPTELEVLEKESA